MIDVLNEVNKGNYKRTMVNDKNENEKEKTLRPNSGKIIYQNNVIKFEKVPLVTPNGITLF